MSKHFIAVIFGSELNSFQKGRLVFFPQEATEPDEFSPAEPVD